MNTTRFRRIPTFFAVVAVLGTFSSQSRSQTVAPSGLQKADPIVCNANDRVVLHGRSIETAGNGVVVQGNCSVELVDSHVVADGLAVLVQGNGQAVVTRSYVEGRLGALVAQGNGSIRYGESTLRGGTRTGGRGRITGDDVSVHGGGTATGDVAADVAGVLDQVRIGAGGIRIGEGESTVSIGAGGVVVEDGTGTVSIGAGGVEVDDGTDTVSVRPSAEGLRVEAGDVALTLDADVTVDGDLLRLGVGTSIEISAGWRDAGSSSYRAADTDRLLVELGASEDRGQLHLGLAGDVLFDVDSTAIQPAGAAELRKVAHVLRQRAVGEARLVGHTDSLGTDEYNQKLSQARAVAVMRWLHREEGIPAQLMVGQGLGSTQPIAYNTMPDGSDNPAGRAKNRRVEIFIATDS